MNNEEIINKEWLDGREDCTYDKWDFWEVLQLMDLARADERKKIVLDKSEPGNELAFEQGYDKGCFETKEKVKKIILDLEGQPKYSDSLYYCKYFSEDLLKELSCPEKDNDCKCCKQICDCEYGCSHPHKDEGEKE